MKDKPEPAKGAFVTDPELAALSRVMRLLAKLDEAARTRIVSYLVSKFMNQDGVVNADRE